VVLDTRETLLTFGPTAKHSLGECSSFIVKVHQFRNSTEKRKYLWKSLPGRWIEQRLNVW
jgi:hypothetical protein